MLHNTEEKILRLPKVLSKTGLTRTTLYNMIKEERIPKPIGLGMRCSGWLLSEVNSWIDFKIHQRDCEDHAQTTV
ncbi:MAG: AlpA family transcriptional regulator [Bacteroidales bacterium]|nr:AlpA family transcriptional regulator [Bacteroidales bacterium]